MSGWATICVSVTWVKALRMHVMSSLMRVVVDSFRVLHLSLPVVTISCRYRSDFKHFTIRWRGYGNFQHTALQYQALPKAKHVICTSCGKYPHLWNHTGRMNLSNANTFDILSDTTQSALPRSSGLRGAYSSITGGNRRSIMIWIMTLMFQKLMVARRHVKRCNSWDVQSCSCRHYGEMRDVTTKTIMRRRSIWRRFRA